MRVASQAVPQGRHGFEFRVLISSLKFHDTRPETKDETLHRDELLFLPAVLVGMLPEKLIG